jgi:hypothetical protein
MNVSAILEEVQPLADLAHEVIEANNALQLSLRYNHYRPSVKPKLEIYVKGQPPKFLPCPFKLMLSYSARKLSSKPPNFPEVTLPSTLLENIPKLRLEADQTLEHIPQLTERVEHFIQNPPNGMLSVDQREVYALLDEYPTRTIGIFHQICRKNRDRAFNGAYYAYEFRVDTCILAGPGEWTRNLNSKKPLLMSVQMKNGIAEKDLERFGRTLPNGAVKEEYAQSLPDDMNRIYWVVGLTCDERESLLLHPLVRDVKPFQPKFDMSMAFD